MKKILLSLITVIFLVSPVIVLSAVLATPNTDIWNVIDRVGNTLWTFLLIAAAIFILVAAYLFITAGGDPAKVGQARMMILYAVIAIVVGVAAQGIVIFVRKYMETGSW